MKGEKDLQLSATSIKLRFWLVCVYKAWMRWMWAVLSEWDKINTEIWSFLWVMSCLWLVKRHLWAVIVWKGKRVSEIRWVWAKDDEWWAWGKLNHEQSSKQTKGFRESGCHGQLWDVYGVGMCKQGGECWCYGDCKLRKVVRQLKRAWGSLKKANRDWISA